MPDIKPEALEAAGKQLRSVCGKIDQIFAQRDPPPPREWAALYEREVKSILDAADLVPRGEIRKGWQELMAERDEAHRDMNVLGEKYYGTLAQLVVLRGALANTTSLLENFSIPRGVTRRQDRRYRDTLRQSHAALTDTDTAAAQYQRVPEGYVVVPLKLDPRGKECKVGRKAIDEERQRVKGHGAIDQYGDTLALLAYQAIVEVLAATPVAGEPEDGG